MPLGRLQHGPSSNACRVRALQETAGTCPLMRLKRRVFVVLQCPRWSPQSFAPVGVVLAAMRSIVVAFGQCRRSGSLG
eukprot:7709999-Pyramimonas_sp.AAC.1